MIFRINRLRNLLDEQLNAEEKNWEEIEKLSKELDSMILEYWNMEGYGEGENRSNKKKLV